MGIKTMFRRKDDYCAEVIEETRRLLKRCDEIGKEVLVIPGEQSLIFYYRGKPFFSLSDKSWECFSKSYNKYFNEKDKVPENVNPEKASKVLSDLKKVKASETKEAIQFYFDNLEIILPCIGAGLPSDKERASQQVIALNNSFRFDEDLGEVEQYWVCGFEAAIPEQYFPNLKKPEIDLVAVNPYKKEILLIEYKCTEGALLYNKCNIVKHCNDYLDILYNSDNSLKEDLTGELLKAYNLMLKIYEKPEWELRKEEFHMNIGFLVTQFPCKDKGEIKIQPRQLNQAKGKLDECLKVYSCGDYKPTQEELKERIKCIIWPEPEEHKLRDWKALDDWNKWYR